MNSTTFKLLMGLKQPGPGSLGSTGTVDRQYFRTLVLRHDIKPLGLVV